MERPRNIKIRHSGLALAATMRKGGAMKHRLAPKSGARNEQADLLAEYEDDQADRMEVDMSDIYDDDDGYSDGGRRGDADGRL